MKNILVFLSYILFLSINVFSQNKSYATLTIYPQNDFSSLVRVEFNNIMNHNKKLILTAIRIAIEPQLISTAKNKITMPFCRL